MTAVVEAKAKKRVGRVHRSTRGFTLVEILIVVIILGILASIVIPQFSNASHEVREAMLKDDLRFLRTQIAVFRAQHRDISPGYPGGSSTSSASSSDFVAQMTEYSDDFFHLSATPSNSCPLGIYLERMPVNPLNGLDTMLVVPDGQSLPTTADGQYGWIYQASTQQVLSDATGNDGNGTAYITY